MTEPVRLTAAEAAARLGVKKETLYAYVSRGMLTRRKDDGRTSTFDPREVDRLRDRQRGARTTGLDVTLPTRLTLIDGGRYWYRGRPVEDLVAAGAGYEQVAELLWTGELPADRPTWPADPDVLATIAEAQGLLPATAPLIDRLRLIVTVASAFDPLRHHLAPASVAAVGRNLVPLLVDGLPTSRPGDATTPPPTRVATRLAHALATTAVDDAWCDLVDLALVLLADHELATATVGVRVAASVRADPYSAVLAGFGALAGTLHGAASVDAHRLLADALDRGAAAAVGAYLRQRRRVPGFGHTLYRQDPRNALLLERLRPLAADPLVVAIDETIALMAERTAVAPNVDFALAALSHAAGLGAEGGEAMFAVARCAGWLAHAAEEYGERPLRFRPTARYIGPPPD